MNYYFKNTLFSLSISLLYSGFALALESPTGFIEYQTKSLANSDEAQDLGANWSKENIQQIYGQLGTELTVLENKIKVNTFFRQTNSVLLEDESNLSYQSFYPQVIIGRDLLKMHHSKISGKDQSEIMMHKLNYSWGDDEVAFTAGRMTISYGEGHTINPINPFNHNSNLSNSYGINQVNDGVRIVFNKDPKLKLNLYFFGDKSYTDYDEEITRTVFLRGDWKKSKQTHINYVLGEDKKRHKYGLEVKHSLEHGVGFAQLVRISQQLDNEEPDSDGLFHSLFGYEQDLTQIWTARIEFGKFQVDPSATSGINTNFLPFEGFIALNNLFRMSDKANIELNIVSDTDSKATFYKMAGTYSLNNFSEFRLFTSGLGSQPEDDTKYVSQNFIPAEIGLALRGKF